jgi:CDP-paratose 2-epimerase
VIGRGSHGNGASHAIGLEGTTVITGGAGFIGTNLAHRIAAMGGHVVLLDNLSRPNVIHNARWLRTQYGNHVQLVTGDVRDRDLVRRVLARADRVFHFAAQVSVTASLVDPVLDFEVNARGTLNVLEALRATDREIPLFFTSTNKVYGSLGDVALELREQRWSPVDRNLRATGIDEQRHVDFHSPYGCSKGSADQYVLDWARSYGMPNVVFRMSSVYGPRQLGTEDHGWVAHFLIRAMRGERIVIRGDGMQVRDLLFVDDLVDAFTAAHAHIDAVRGQAFNVGGGPDNQVSVLELIEMTREITGRRVDIELDQAHAGNRRWYVSDLRRLGSAADWRPHTSVRRGLERLAGWVQTATSVLVRREEEPQPMFEGDAK